MKHLYLLVLLSISLSCSSTSNTTPPDNTVEDPKFSYLALGDSYTIGESVEPSERWPVQLAARLRQQNFNMAAPKIIAKTGWTTRNLLNGIENELDVQRDFDLVSVLIGVNNQYQGRSITEYEEELRQVFRKAINHSKRMEAGVFAVSIPDYGYTPFGSAHQEEISAELEEFNAVFKRVAEEFGVEYFNITPISQEAQNNPDLVAPDGLHPSGLMYSQWVDLFANQVAEKLPK
ncbi:SGNH/GDSL hydrolase family protein [Christiangramia flava]|uniref:Lysophospholipase L1 and related esterases n=1 Tax=Christiangramia flava JLT2011 TaxID=1229726 RepID=A0A1L7I7R3_9FLAO|nr:SGNH/GDSL hydrolase family protein [Christiangramia flava]APU69152.1 Lysophospholipase L1 and related esterases [Christiangramia flava JLT2011]